VTVGAQVKADFRACIVRMQQRYLMKPLRDDDVGKASLLVASVSRSSNTTAALTGKLTTGRSFDGVDACKNKTSLAACIQCHRARHSPVGKIRQSLGCLQLGRA